MSQDAIQPGVRLRTRPRVRGVALLGLALLCGCGQGSSPYGADRPDSARAGSRGDSAARPPATPEARHWPAAVELTARHVRKLEPARQGRLGCSVSANYVEIAAGIDPARKGEVNRMLAPPADWLKCRPGVASEFVQAVSLNGAGLLSVRGNGLATEARDTRPGEPLLRTLTILVPSGRVLELTDLVRADREKSFKALMRPAVALRVKEQKGDAGDVDVVLDYLVLEGLPFALEERRLDVFALERVPPYMRAYAVSGFTVSLAALDSADLLVRPSPLELLLRER